MERLFRRAGLPLGMTQGFHPKPRMSFPAALALGIEGLDEIMEIELAREVAADALLRQLNDASVPGLAFLRVDVLPPDAVGSRARVTHVTYEIDVPADRRPDVARRAAALRALPTCPIRRPDRPDPLDLLEFLEDLKMDETVLSMTLRVTPQANPGPRDVLAALELDDLEREGSRLRRACVAART